MNTNNLFTVSLFGVEWYWYALVMMAILVVISGCVLIRERQVGVVIKRFAKNSLPPGRLVALNGEAGFQADTLAPGLYFGYWPWQYRVLKAQVTVVPQGEIALVLAADGDAIPAGRILGKVVDCDKFQDARKFLAHGGEKGRQLGILTAGTYRINTALFTVITSATAMRNGMDAGQLTLQRVEPDMVGIITTLDGQAIEAGEIAGPAIHRRARQLPERTSVFGWRRAARIAGTNPVVRHVEPESVVRASGTGAHGADTYWLRRRRDLVRRRSACGRQWRRVQTR